MASELDDLVSPGTDPPDRVPFSDWRRRNPEEWRRSSEKRQKLAVAARKAQGRATREKIWTRYLNLGGGTKAERQIATERGCSAHAVHEHITKHRRDMRADGIEPPNFKEKPNAVKVDRTHERVIIQIKTSPPTWIRVEADGIVQLSRDGATWKTMEF